MMQGKASSVDAELERDRFMIKLNDTEKFTSQVLLQRTTMVDYTD